MQRECHPSARAEPRHLLQLGRPRDQPLAEPHRRQCEDATRDRDHVLDDDESRKAFRHGEATRCATRRHRHVALLEPFPLRHPGDPHLIACRGLQVAETSFRRDVDARHRVEVRRVVAKSVLDCDRGIKRHEIEVTAVDRPQQSSISLLRPLECRSPVSKTGNVVRTSVFRPESHCFAGLLDDCSASNSNDWCTQSDSNARPSDS